METHVYYRTAPVDCQIDFLSFERLEMSNMEHIWLYPLPARQHGSRHIYLAVADTRHHQPLKSLLERMRWVEGSGERSKVIKNQEKIRLSIWQHLLKNMLQQTFCRYQQLPTHHCQDTVGMVPQHLNLLVKNPLPNSRREIK